MAFFTVCSTWLFQNRLSCCRTPRSLNLDTLSKHKSFIRRRSGSTEFLQDEIHIPAWFSLNLIACYSQFPSSKGRPSTFCIFDNSPFGILSDAAEQSSAYLHIFTRTHSSSGIESSKPSIKIPNNIGDMTDRYIVHCTCRACPC